MNEAQIEKARNLYALLDQQGIKVNVKLTLQGDAVTPAIERKAREVAGELRLLAAARAIFPQEHADIYVDELRSALTKCEAAESADASGVTCKKCRGSGREPTALMQWEQIEYLLRGLMWPDVRILLVRDEIRRDEVLASIRGGGLDLLSPDGSIRTLHRYQ